MNTDFKLGQVVELVKCVRVPWRENVELLLNPGFKGAVIAPPLTKNGLMLIDVNGIEGLDTVIVQPDMVKGTAEVVHIEVVSEEEIERED